MDLMRKVLAFSWCVAALTVARSGVAQTAICPAAADTSAAADPVTVKPDLLFRATVHAQSIRFDRAPEQKLQLLGCPARDRLVVTTRTNLPTPVNTGVTYHNATISIEIRSYVRCVTAAQLSDLCIIADSTERKRRGQ